MAIVIGGALGISGAIFQSLTLNPLGSPDIIGFNAGAYTGALVSMLLLGGGFVQTTVGAFAGDWPPRRWSTCWRSSAASRVSG